LTVLRGQVIYLLAMEAEIVFFGYKFLQQWSCVLFPMYRGSAICVSVYQLLLIGV